MKLIPLVARRAFTFRRLTGAALSCTAGERCEVTPIEAVLLRARGDVDYAPVRPAVSPLPEKKPSRRRYRRRDLEAEE